MSLKQRADLLNAMRSTGYAGGVIQSHRAMRTERFTRVRWVEIIGLPLLFDLILLAFLPQVMQFWQMLTAWAVAFTGVPADLSSQAIDGWPLHPMVSLPWLELSASVPSYWQWWLNCVACVVLLVLSFLINKENTPMRYVLRLIVIVHGSACLFFALYPAGFTHSLPEYHHTCLETVLILTFLVPWIHSITFNILNKSIVEKILLTAISMAYLLVAAPLHYFLAAIIMHYGSLMFMPMLFILFSLMLNVMMLIAFYAWAMSWEFGSGHQSS
ncbi:hypothetical protein [Aquitalea sp. ASV11]|uniref:hypothetical protein n=1 Tax=Aquitalea sp. ASV11 TaxID=2795103 RepID=UPI0018ECCBA8|nr:hypothetical protein [Aquitalea sp. ASV11]